MDRKTLREIELWCALAAAVLGILVPFYGVIIATPAAGDVGGFLLVIIGLALAVAAGAMIDTQSQDSRITSGGLALLWSGTAPMLAMTILPFGNLGLYVLPAAILALVAALAGSFATFARRPTPQGGD
ncbi:MAG TPA: hypothetical protein VFZ25_05940 [Chloroflexota bacterium]|nr:hypothetical protein [Chloroflexota bacterium]